MRLSRTGRRLAVVAIASGLLATGCASAGPGGSASDPALAASTGFIGQPLDTGDPTPGGTLTFGSFAFPSTLDPIKTLAAGSNGGSEMGAIYDTLVSVNKETSEFEPQLAETLTANDDFTAFTITLPEGATFSDGSPLDAKAVKWSIDRFNAAQVDVSQAWTKIVTAIETPDERTVVFQLNAHWADFPAMLGMGPGMIVAESSEAGGTFSPIGAGPYTLSKFAPNEEIVLTARADYIGGKPHLDTLRFVPTAGTQGQLESLNSGQLDMAYMYRNDPVQEQAVEAGLGGFHASLGLGSIGIINNREGRPGADVRVRQAIASGVDPAAVNDRVNGGVGPSGPDLMAESSRWSGEVHGLPFDPEKAKELVNQAKADGFDGKLTYLAINEPSAEATGLAVQAALNTVGFDVTIERVNSVPDLVRKVYQERDFDMTRTSLSFMEEAPYLRLYGGLGSDSRNNSVGYADPEMDALLAELQHAPTEEQKRSAIDQIQQRVNETVPYTMWGPAAVLVAWQPDVRGLKFASDNTVLFDTAWVAQG